MVNLKPSDTVKSDHSFLLFHCNTSPLLVTIINKVNLYQRVCILFYFYFSPLLLFTVVAVNIF